MDFLFNTADFLAKLEHRKNSRKIVFSMYKNLFSHGISNKKPLYIISTGSHPEHLIKSKCLK